MKQSRIKQIGKRGKYWEECRKRLKILFERNGIDRCELRFPKCAGDNFLGFAHRHKRQWYYSKPGREKLLGSPNQVLMACNFCHEIIENDAELTDRVFNLRRPIKLI